jgi:hypothetical protein
MDIITRYKGGGILSRGLKGFIILSCVILITAAFYFGYYSTVKKNEGQNSLPNPKPTTIAKNNNTPSQIDRTVNNVSVEEIVTPQTVLQKTIESINTGNTVDEYNGAVPEDIVNMNEAEVKEYFTDYGNVTEFSKDKIVVVKRLPNLPDRYLIKIENDNIIVYRTDDEGTAYKYEEFEPKPCKNKDPQLEKGIEVESEDEVYETIGDYQ